MRCGVDLVEAFTMNPSIQAGSDCAAPAYALGIQLRFPSHM